MIVATSDPRSDAMVFAADYPFLEVMWTIFVFFGWVMWVWLLVMVFSDIFRRRDIGGWTKAAWSVFAIVLPFLGVLTYLISQGPRMSERDADTRKPAQPQFDDYARPVAGSGGPAAEIDRAHSLLDSGAITQAEYEDIKRKTLAAV
jgi:hypothetical protein